MTIKRRWRVSGSTLAKPIQDLAPPSDRSKLSHRAKGRRGVAIAASVLLLATMVGCSSSSNDGSAGTTTSPPASSPSSSGTPFPQAEAEDAAEASLLDLGDFPAGWSAHDDDEETDEDQSKVQMQLASCLGMPSDTFRMI